MDNCTSGKVNRRTIVVRSSYICGLFEPVGIELKLVDYTNIDSRFVIKESVERRSKSEAILLTINYPRRVDTEKVFSS